MIVFSKKNLSQKGFTLLELIVVFTVIAILSTVGLASFVSYSRTQTLQQSYNDLINDLNTAKSNSFSQVKPQACSSYILTGYTLSINTSSSNPVTKPAWRSYDLSAICSGNIFVVKTIILPTGVSFNNASGVPPTTTTNVSFSVLTGGVIGAGNMVLSAYSNTKTITISGIGEIR